MNLCECGCGQVVHNKYISGHNMKNLPRTKEHNLKIGLSNKGKSRGKGVPKSSNHKLKIKLGNILAKPKRGNWYNCPTCGKKIYRILSYKNKSGTYYCSVACRPHKGENNNNWKEKKSKTCLICGNLIWIIPSDNSRKFCSIKCRTISLKNNFKGQSNPNWQGGISNLPYPFEFNNKLKKLVRDKGNHSCQLCGISELSRKLGVHHIDYNKTNNSFANLIALCNRCNTKVNFNREFWRRYFDACLSVNPSA